jgi:RNA polymerase sigma factor (sigma-70 family)
LEKIKSFGNKISDSTLWSRLKAGDEESFSILFERYYGPLVNYGKTLSSIDDAVKDCVQDVFVDIWKYSANLDVAIVVKAYLFSCVRNRIGRLHKRDHIFSHLKEMDSFDFLFDFSTEDQLIADETMLAKIKNLNDFINNLPERQKEALYLRYHQGLTVEQVAEVLNMNYQSTKNLLHRAISSLRKDFPASVIVLILNFTTNF